MMTGKERIMKALALEEPDKVPFVDYINEGVRQALAGDEVDVTDEAAFAKAIRMDAIYFMEYCAPLFCEGGAHAGADNQDPDFVGEGLLKTEKDLSKMVFPDPHNDAYYDTAKRFVERYGDSGLAIWAGTRPLGLFNTIFSMGYETFAYALYENRKLVEDILDRFIEWNLVLIEKLQNTGIDFLVAFNDMAFRTGPLVSPQIFRDIFLPRMKEIAAIIDIPWVFHSDGNLNPVMKDIVSLGMDGLNPIEPGAMDLKETKEKYGDKLCLWGNIDLSYTLTRGTPEEVDKEVAQRIREAGQGGGYILASANSIPDYCKVENVLAMIEAREKYGKYPLNF